ARHDGSAYVEGSRAAERATEARQRHRALVARRPRSEAVTRGSLSILFDSVPIARHLVRLKPRSRGQGGCADRGREGPSEAGSAPAALRETQTSAAARAAAPSAVR